MVCLFVSDITAHNAFVRMDSYIAMKMFLYTFLTIGAAAGSLGIDLLHVFVHCTRRPRRTVHMFPLTL